MTKTLAEIAIDEGLATREGLDRAARFAESRGEPLVVGLVRECGVDEVALAAAIHRQMRVAVVEVDSVTTDSDAIRQLARDVAWKRRAVPLAVSTGGAGATLEVAMADPSDAVAVAEIEHRTGCRVESVLMVLSGVEQLIERGYRGFVTKVMKRQDQAVARPASPPPSGAGEAAGKKRQAAQPGPTTAPYHRVTDEADPRLLVRTLVAMLEERGLLSEDEFEQRVLDVMKRRETDDVE